MKLLIRLVITSILPLLLIYMYKLLASAYADTNALCNQVSLFSWKEALLLHFIFVLYNLVELVYKIYSSIVRKWVWITIWYIIVYGCIALPYMIISLIDFRYSGFLHFLPIISLIDYYTQKIVHSRS